MLRVATAEMVAEGRRGMRPRPQCWWVLMDSNHRGPLGPSGLQPDSFNRSDKHPLNRCVARRRASSWQAGRGGRDSNRRRAFQQPGSEPGGFDHSPTPHRSCSTNSGGESGIRTHEPGCSPGHCTSNAAHSAALPSLHIWWTLSATTRLSRLARPGDHPPIFRAQEDIQTI